MIQTVDNEKLCNLFIIFRNFKENYFNLMIKCEKAIAVTSRDTKLH